MNESVKPSAHGMPQAQMLSRLADVKTEPFALFRPPQQLKTQTQSDQGLHAKQPLHLTLPPYSDMEYHQVQQQLQQKPQPSSQLLTMAAYLENRESASSTATLSTHGSVGPATYSSAADSFPSYSPGSSNSVSMQLQANANGGASPIPDAEREESPPPPPRVYKPCVVCSDKSSGYHYGVSSCEGCKGFFRRSVQKNMQYNCQKEGDCEINKTTRNRCQHCRLKKCFEKGMSKEAVRNDRNKKRKKEDGDDASSTASKDQLDESGGSGGGGGGGGGIENLTDADKELIQLVLRAHTCTLPGQSPTAASSPLQSVTRFGQHDQMAPASQDATTLGVRSGFGDGRVPVDPSSDGQVVLHRDSPAAALFSESSPSSSVGSSSGSPGASSGVQSPANSVGGAAGATAGEGSPSPPTVRTVVWESIKELSSEGIIKVVDFAKQLPCFTALPISDQITLLKAACLEIMILRLCMRYSKDCNSLAFANGIMVTREELEVGGFGSLAHSVFDFAQALANLKVDETEFALLAAICLISGDRYGLQDTERVEKTQDKLIEALKHYLQGHQPCEHLLFARLLMKVTDLRSISVKGAERVLHLRMEATHDIPPLVAEMLHRTENVCIP